VAIRERAGNYTVTIGNKNYGTRDSRDAAEQLETWAKVQRENEAKAGMLVPHIKDVTCGAFADRYIEDYGMGLSDATVKAYTTAIVAFRKQFGSTALVAISTGPKRADARVWARKQTRGTQNVVRTMLGKAHGGLVTDNPFAKLGVKQSRGRKDLLVLTRDEVYKLADGALMAHGDYGPTDAQQDYLRGLHRHPAGGNGGARLGRRWRAVHIRKSLSVTNKLKLPKNGKMRYVVLPAQAREALEGLPRYEGVPWVFTTITGGQVTRTALQRMWNPVRAYDGSGVTITVTNDQGETVVRQADGLL
jgi:integrase